MIPPNNTMANMIPIPGIFHIAPMLLILLRILQKYRFEGLFDCMLSQNGGECKKPPILRAVSCVNGVF